MSVTNWESKNADFDENSPEYKEMTCEAHNGNPKAQHGLGMWNDVREKYEEAEKWYRRAADQGHEGSAEALDDMKKLSGNSNGMDYSCCDRSADSSVS